MTYKAADKLFSYITAVSGLSHCEIHLRSVGPDPKHGALFPACFFEMLSMMLVTLRRLQSMRFALEEAVPGKLCVWTRIVEGDTLWPGPLYKRRIVMKEYKGAVVSPRRAQVSWSDTRRCSRYVRHTEPQRSGWRQTKRLFPEHIYTHATADASIKAVLRRVRLDSNDAYYCLITDSTED